MVSAEGATPSMVSAFTVSMFCSRKEKPNTPSEPGVRVRVWTMALSFSPESTQAPSSRRVWVRVSKRVLSLFRAATAGTNSPPGAMPSSRKASRVPEVGGGP
ncbi:hypothetical protein D3C85_664760 [compost metagenome]